VRGDWANNTLSASGKGTQLKEKSLSHKRGKNKGGYTFGEEAQLAAFRKKKGQKRDKKTKQEGRHVAIKEEKNDGRFLELGNGSPFLSGRGESQGLRGVGMSKGGSLSLERSHGIKQKGIDDLPAVGKRGTGQPWTGKKTTVAGKERGFFDHPPTVGERIDRLFGKSFVERQRPVSGGTDAGQQGDPWKIPQGSASEVGSC